MAVVTLVVAKVDKGERVGQWKGPLIGVMWADDGARGTRPRGVGKDEGDG